MTEAEVAEGSNEQAQPYDFLNEQLGYCLMFYSDEKQNDTDDEDKLSEHDEASVEPVVSSAAYETPIV